MAAKESQEMKRAKRLIVDHGYTVAAAAARAGITTNAVYMSKWWRERKNELSGDKGQ